MKAWPILDVPLKAPRDAIRVRYFFHVPRGVTQEELGDYIRLEEGSGKWLGEGPPTPLFLRCQARLLRAGHLFDKRSGWADIAYPIINFPKDVSSLPAALLSSFGGPLFEREFLGAQWIRMEDIAFPQALLSLFAGPTLGIRGFRERLKLGRGGTGFGGIVKPECGLGPEEVATFCKDAALGGVVFIKDGEKTNGGDYCPPVDRYVAVAKALNEAEQKTGKPVLYCVKLSGDAYEIGPIADEIAGWARRLGRERTTGFMVNVLTESLSSVRVLRRCCPEYPIYVHRGGLGAFYREQTGISLEVFAKLIRVAGGDFFRAHMPGGYLIGDTPARSLRLVEILRGRMGQLKDVIPALSGGANVQTVALSLKAYGSGILSLSGSAIKDHPMGSEKGAVAFAEAVKAERAGVSLVKYAKTHLALAAALRQIEEAERKGKK